MLRDVAPSVTASRVRLRAMPHCMRRAGRGGMPRVDSDALMHGRDQALLESCRRHLKLGGQILLSASGASEHVNLQYK